MKKIKTLFVSLMAGLFMSSIVAPNASQLQVSAQEYSEDLTIVWYPNESGSDFAAARDEISAQMSEATGKEVNHLTTTDYNIAIEAIASGQANFAFMGAVGYVQANELNENVQPLVVPSGASGTLEDAVYYSWINVREENADQYLDENGNYSLENIRGKSMSFVSESSTSGFVVPTGGIISAFPEDNLTEEDLISGGEDMFFSEVQFGGSHQGSLYNAISGMTDIAAACDTCVFNYVEPVEGEMNAIGTVYAIREDADQPFNNVTGERFVAISVTPVINAPFAVNHDVTSPEDFETVQALFTSAEFRDAIFVSEEDAEAGVTGLFYANGDNQFVIAEDSFFDPIRELSASNQ